MSVQCCSCPWVEEDCSWQRMAAVCLVGMGLSAAQPPITPIATSVFPLQPRCFRGSKGASSLANLFIRCCYKFFPALKYSSWQKVNCYKSTRRNVTDPLHRSIVPVLFGLRRSQRVLKCCPAKKGRPRDRNRSRCWLFLISNRHTLRAGFCSTFLLVWVMLITGQSALSFWVIMLKPLKGFTNSYEKMLQDLMRCNNCFIDFWNFPVKLLSS